MRAAERKSQVLAKRLRRQMTDAEIILWARLRHDVIHARRFRRQHPIGPYIADFACVPARLIVEVDGGTHSSAAEVAHDHRRDAYLRAQGWHVFRVTNEDVYKDLDSVLDGIVRFAPPPRPSAGPPIKSGAGSPP